MHPVLLDNHYLNKSIVPGHVVPYFLTFNRKESTPGQTYHVQTQSYQHITCCNELGLIWKLLVPGAIIILFTFQSPRHSVMVTRKLS